MIILFHLTSNYTVYFASVMIYFAHKYKYTTFLFSHELYLLNAYMIKVYERPGGLYSPDIISAKPFAVASHNHHQVVFPCFPPPLGGRQIQPPTTAGPVDTPITSVARMAAAVVGGRLADVKELLVDVLATERYMLHG